MTFWRFWRGVGPSYIHVEAARILPLHGEGEEPVRVNAGDTLEVGVVSVGYPDYERTICQWGAEGYRFASKTKDFATFVRVSPATDHQAQAGSMK